jgi:hypothetical protein
VSRQPNLPQQEQFQPPEVLLLAIVFLTAEAMFAALPINTQNTGYTLVATDAGNVVNMTAGNVTVPAGVFATPFGQAITIYNNQNSSNAIVQGSGVTLRLAGTAATGNRTLARYGLTTLVCVSANTFVISGAGLT